ncbi:hypothetical protein KKC17_00455 [Patescibacteria group bacterium]|nr:hypothetical protein [Patescibacteria group bacterium]
MFNPNKFRRYLVPITMLVLTLVAGSAYAATTIGTNVSTGGTLAVTGASTLTGALAANGGITVDTSQFTVNGTNGNVTIVPPATMTTGTLLALSAAAAVTATDAYKGAYIDLTNVTGDGTNPVYGLHVNDQAAATASTEYGIYVEGTNWDQGLYVADSGHIAGAVTLGSTLAVTGTTTLGGGTAITKVVKGNLADDAFGWVPDATATDFTITADAASVTANSYIGVSVGANATAAVCGVYTRTASTSFQVKCSAAPANAATLQYIIVN